MKTLRQAHGTRADRVPLRVGVCRAWVWGSLFLLCGLFPVTAAGADALDRVSEGAAERSHGWPQFRGPERNGGVDSQLPETPSGWVGAERWRRPLGPGFSGVSIVGERVFTAFGDGEFEYLGAFSAADGEELWRLRLGPIFRDSWGDGPRSTPSVHRETVLALGSSGRLVAARASDGRLLWQRELAALDGIEEPYFGYSPSPLIWKGLVLTEVGASEEGLVRAFRLTDGAEEWKFGAGRAGYSSPSLGAIAGVEQAVFLTRSEVLALDEHGEMLWRWPFDNGSPFDLPIASPLVTQEGGVFVSHRAEGGSAYLRPRLEAGGWSVEVVWQSARMLNHMSSSVEHQGAIFGFHNATLQAMALASGEVLWRQRGWGKGALIRVGGQLVVLAEDGTLHVVHAQSAAFEQLGEVAVFDHKSWTAPSFSEDRLLLRSPRELVALALVADTATVFDAVMATQAEVTTEELALEELLRRHVMAMGSPRATRELEARGTYTTNGEPSAWSLTVRPRGVERRRPQGPHSDSEPLQERIELAVSAAGPASASPDSGSPVSASGTMLLPGTETWAAMSDDQVRGLLEDVLLLHPVMELEGTEWTYGGVQEFDTGRGHLLESSGAQRQRWYLDEETYRPLALFTQRWSWGRMREMRYYFSDWRNVAGRSIAFRIEDEFSSFHRVLEVESLVFLDESLDDPLRAESSN